MRRESGRDDGDFRDEDIVLIWIGVPVSFSLLFRG